LVERGGAPEGYVGPCVRHRSGSRTRSFVEDGNIEEEQVSAENVETVRRLFRAVEERDLAGVLDAYDPEVVIREADSLPYGGEHRGLTGARRHAHGYLRAWNFLQSPKEKRLDATFVDAGDRVVALFRHRAHSADGKKVDLPVVGVYEVRGGRVVEARMFHFDTAEISRFLERASYTT
jgi:ketosteroid isomerase-like protein